MHRADFLSVWAVADDASIFRPLRKHFFFEKKEAKNFWMIGLRLCSVALLLLGVVAERMGC
jgi:hypothetical protein